MYSSKLSFNLDNIPSFTVKEMILLSLIMLTCGFFFVQSFKSYHTAFNDVLDDIFKLSELHQTLYIKYHHTDISDNKKKIKERNRDFEEFMEICEDLFDNIGKLPNVKNQSFFTRTINSFLITSLDD